jgi:CRISPR-associated protein Cmr3
MTDYLIRLKPVDIFFFGSEQTFGYGINTDYFGISNPFPQQTALLGMLRKEILIQAGEYKENAADYEAGDYAQMDKLIGSKSFNVDAAFKGNGNDQDFGCIKMLFPLFLYREGDYFIRAPFDLNLNFDKFKENKARAYLNKERDFIPLLKGYDPKKGIADQFISHYKKKDKKTDEKIIVDSDDIFIPLTKIGIDKNRDEDEDGKFFKQKFYRLQEGYEFAFFAEIDHKLKNSIVSLGAENSSFIMNVEEAKDSFGKLFQHNKRTNRLTLLSNALVESTIYNFCDFAITKTVNFRNIRTQTGDYQYNQNKSKSRKYTFLSSGSVFFMEDENRQAAEDCIKNKNFEKIGYNIFA